MRYIERCFLLVCVARRGRNGAYGMSGADRKDGRVRTSMAQMDMWVRTVVASTGMLAQTAVVGTGMLAWTFRAGTSMWTRTLWRV
jgi:hypothetical protein